MTGLTYDGYELMSDEEMEEFEQMEAEEEDRMFKEAVGCSELLGVNDLLRLGFEVIEVGDLNVCSLDGEAE